MLSIIKSNKPRSVSKEHILKRSDFPYAWNQLISSGSLCLNDLEPELRGRKAITLALNAEVSGYHIKEKVNYVFNTT